MDDGFAQYTSLRARLLWIVHSRPDIACAVSMATQITENLFFKESLISINKLLAHLHRTPHMKLSYTKLDLRSLFLVTYTDTSFQNNHEYRSQLGFIILLADKFNHCCVIHYSSHKSKRVATSSMAAEALAFADGFYNSFIIKHDLQRIMGRELPLLMLTDSKIFFDMLTRKKYTTEKRIMADIASTREAYDAMIISNISLIKSMHNPADALTKIGGNSALATLLQTNKLSHPMGQHVVSSTRVSS